MARNSIGVLKAEVGVGLILIVFKNVNDWQLPNGCHVQRFEEGALLRGPISKKAVHDLPGLLYLRCQRGSRRMCNALPNNSRRPRKMAGRIRQMHRPAKTTAESVLAAKDFGHHRPHRCAQHNRIAVTTIARHNQICFITCGKSSHNARFGSIAKVRVPAYDPWVLDERPFDRFLELTDSHHVCVDPCQPIFAKLVWHGASSFKTMIPLSG